MKTIGFLNSMSEGACGDFVDAFRKGLQGSGLAVGRDVAIEFRWADGRYDRLPALAADLVSRRVDVIAATGGIVSARAALEATKTIPVLFVSGCDAVQAGLVDNLRRPGGNATGVQVSTTEALERRLRTLRELVPGNGRIALLVNPNSFVARMEDTHGRNSNLIVLSASTENEIESAFNRAAEQKAAAILVSADPFFTSRRTQIVACAERTRIPTAYPWREYSDAGGLVSEGPNLTEAYRLIGIYAGRILNGSTPADLPVRVLGEQDFKVEISHRTAQAQNIRVPDSLRNRAELR
ncbi:MAG TPA: ABC transporter substrate-binding protein [Xanthobacteraceae bacterium]|jgi:putative ABC transport system substrate-binding protein|nr:ABC transporter substrate-binding protein [Xanthobacteraceae bacterium]